MNAINEIFRFAWSSESMPVFVMMLCITVLLYLYRREDRTSLLNTLGFFLVCTLGQFFSGVLFVLEFTRAATVFNEVFLIGAGIAVIRLWGLLVFRNLLPLVKLSPPRIAEDFL